MLKLYASACVLISCLISGCAMTDPKVSKCNLADPWIYKSIKADFGQGGWQLFVGSYGEVGVPIIAYVHLFAKKGDQIRVISTPLEMANLDGISVVSEKEALIFVRLFTDPSIFMCFSSPNALEYEPQTAILGRGTDGFRIIRKLIYVKEKTVLGQRLYRVEEKVSFKGVYQMVGRQFLGYLSEQEAGVPIFE